LAKHRLSRRTALDRREAASSVAPVFQSNTTATCVLAFAPPIAPLRRATFRQTLLGNAADRGLRQNKKQVALAKSQSILVVEDEGSIASFIAMYLRKAGYAVRTAGTGAAAVEEVAAEVPTLIVLDLMLPDIDGIDVCRRIRQTSDVPILMLSARDEDVDKIIGLEVGADDYLTKPFNPGELVARVKSILRRAGPERKELDSAVIEHGELRVDAGRREVSVRGDEVQLAPKEFDLLWELLDHRGLVLTRDQLLERVWGYTFAGDTRTVDVHVRQLRRKIGKACPIVTVWGVGYKVSTEPKVAQVS
jgi:DNA-binding response OmpR family regulator